MDPRDLPVGGITSFISVPVESVRDVFTALTVCGHGHVFVVDQSRMVPSRGAVRFWLSDSGLRCVEKEWPGDEPFGS